MKIVRQGAIPRTPRFPWLNHEWQCPGCGTVVVLEEEDADIYAKNYVSPFLFREETIDVYCPLEKRWISFRRWDIDYG